MLNPLVLINSQPQIPIVVNSRLKVFIARPKQWPSAKHLTQTKSIRESIQSEWAIKCEFELKGFNVWNQNAYNKRNEAWKEKCSHGHISPIKISLIFHWKSILTKCHTSACCFTACCYWFLIQKNVSDDPHQNSPVAIRNYF